MRYKHLEAVQSYSMLGEFKKIFDYKSSLTSCFILSLVLFYHFFRFSPISIWGVIALYTKEKPSTIVEGWLRMKSGKGQRNWYGGKYRRKEEMMRIINLGVMRREMDSNVHRRIEKATERKNGDNPIHQHLKKWLKGK